MRTSSTCGSTHLFLFLRVGIRQSSRVHEADLSRGVATDNVGIESAADEQRAEQVGVVETVATLISQNLSRRPERFWLEYRSSLDRWRRGTCD